MNINYPMDVRTITSMRNIIEQFLERQKLVAKAMLEIHPGPLQLAGTHILGIEIAPYISAWQAKLEDAHFARNWQRGIWQIEWEHYAHGTGCRLTHVHTGEPIEWDAPDLAAFDEMWFWRHLEWRIKQTTNPKHRDNYNDWLHRIYQQMRTMKIISQAESGKLKISD